MRTGAYLYSRKTWAQRGFITRPVGPPKAGSRDLKVLEEWSNLYPSTDERGDNLCETKNNAQRRNLMHGGFYPFMDRHTSISAPILHPLMGLLSS
ncbi:MAG: hypothetical protein Q9215_001196 [Flavoplaca cf. flavocitrina]